MPLTGLEPSSIARLCGRCNKPVTGHGNKKYCVECIEADPHRNAHRNGTVHKLMFVSVDGEGRHDDNGIMQLHSLSYGREDGTSGSIVVNGDCTAALHWLFDNVAGHHISNDIEYRQVPVSFFFDWDAAILLRSTDDAELSLIRKVQHKVETALCGTIHPEGEVCQLKHKDGGRLHRYKRSDVMAVINEGGESDLVAWDERTGFAFAYTPHRRFYCEHRPNGDRYEDWRRIDIHDTGRVFTGGLESVIAKWRPKLTESQSAAIAWGKQARKTNFSGATDEMITQYSEAECVAHSRCLIKLLDSITKASNIRMRKDRVFGAGSVASAVMRHYHVPTRIKSSREFYDDAQMVYFGGMIETTTIGLAVGLTDAVDIQSAYPAALVTLECMKLDHGRWITEEFPTTLPASNLGFAVCQWDISDDDTSTPPFMVRTRKGSVRQPLVMSETRVTIPEARSAVNRFGDSIDVRSVTYWLCECECDKPFHFMEAMYNRRMELKNELTTLEPYSDQWFDVKSVEEALKLILNSCYGKVAQRKPTPGVFANIHYAAAITGLTRVKVREEAWLRESQGGQVVYQHTDSVLSTGGAPVDQGTALGMWGLENPSENLIIFQPGLTYAPDPKHKNATRGVDKSKFRIAVDEWSKRVDFTRHPSTWPVVIVNQQRMVSRRQAHSRGKPWQAGSFEAHTSTINVITSKRNFSLAEPVVGCPTLWKIPPVFTVPDAATLQDLKNYQTMLDKLKASGEDDWRMVRDDYDC